MKRSIIVLAIIALSVLSLTPKAALAREKAAALAENAPEISTRTLTPASSPIESQIPFGDESVRIAQSFSVKPNPDGQGTHVEMSLITETPPELKVKKYNLGQYNGPIEIQNVNQQVEGATHNDADSNVASSRYQTVCTARGFFVEDCSTCTIFLHGDAVLTCEICTLGFDDNGEDIVNVDCSPWYEPLLVN